MLNIKYLSLMLTAAFLVYFPVSASGEDIYSNPVIRGDVPDPTVIRIGRNYYAAGTSSEWAPFYPIFKSDDLVNWKQVGHVFEKQPEWASGSFWAPELFVRDGKVYCYYTARKKSDGISCIGMAVSDSPEGGFVDMGPVIEYGSEAIDAFVFDDGGQLYISWKAYGLDNRPIEILGSRLSDDGMTLEGEPFTMLVDDERIGMEGQCHFKSGEYYYIIYAARGCCGPGSDYEVRLARSKNFSGPYEKCPGNPVLSGGDGEFMSCGHGTIVKSRNGRMFYLCHAYLKGAGFFVGRQPVLHELVGTGDGWFRFKTGNVAEKVIPVPFKGSRQKVETGFADEFNGRSLKPDWSWDCHLPSPEFRTEKGNLVLSGNSEAGNSGTVLCVRPQSASYSFETYVTNTEAALKGLVLYGDKSNNIAFGTEGDNLVVRQTRGGKTTMLHEQPWTGGAFLKITVSAGKDIVLEYGRMPDGSDSEVLDIPSDDVSYMIRWDRMQRPGLICSGCAENHASFSFFRLDNIE